MTLRVYINKTRIKEGIPLSVIFDSSGKIAAVKLLCTDGNVKRIRYAACVRGDILYHCASEEMPFVDIDGMIKKSGIMLLEIASGHPRLGVEGLTFRVYSEEKGLYLLSFNDFCQMAADDIRNRKFRFVNLDYRHLLQEVRRGGLHDYACDILYDIGTLLKNRQLYSNNIDTQLGYLQWDIEWWRNKTTVVSAATDLLCIKGEVSDNSLWMPDSLLFPFVYMYGNFKGEEIVFPEKVISWGVLLWNVPNLAFDKYVFPKSILGSTNVNIQAMSLLSRMIIPYSSCGGSIVSLYDNKGICFCYIKDVGMPNLASCCDNPAITVNILRLHSLDTVVIELNTSTAIDIAILGNPMLKYIYLIDNLGTVKMSGMCIKLEFDDLASGVTIHASPKVHKYLLRKAKQIVDKAAEFVIFDGDARQKFNIEN